MSIKVHSKRLRNIYFAILGLAFLTFIGLLIYFVGGISSVYPPIQKYEYSGNVTKLVQGIKDYVLADTSVTYEITDAVGNNDHGYAIFMTIKLTSNSKDLLYDLKIQDDNNINDGTKSEIALVGAHNLSNTTGGYRIVDPEVKALVDNFNTYFLVSLKKRAHISVVPLN
ncbi:hypothetical protein GZH53_05600 [Flavihumibacter sp. R14]|nr:hypothetical protein [Flavihumibacter soli]